MKKLELSLSIPFKSYYDIIVAGGGVAGVAGVAYCYYWASYLSLVNRKSHGNGFTAIKFMAMTEESK